MRWRREENVELVPSLFGPWRRDAAAEEMKTETVRRSSFEARCRLIICSPGTLFTFQLAVEMNDVHVGFRGGVILLIGMEWSVEFAIKREVKVKKKVIVKLL